MDSGLNKSETASLPGSSKDNNGPDVAVLEEFLNNKMPPNCQLRVSLEEYEELSTEDESSSEECENVIVVHMDVQKPLEYLRSLLESKTGRSLVGFPFTLQQSQVLDSSKNLVEQCVEAKGIVQVNVRIEDDPSLPLCSIDILDVLKPADSVDNDIKPPPLNKVNIHYPNIPDCSDADLHCWMPDIQFKQNQIRLGIPLDPAEWSEAHVRHWMVWAVRKFDLSHVKLAEWRGIDGKKLVTMAHPEFVSKVPCDPDKVFWKHYVVLLRCHVVAIPKEAIEGVEDTPANMPSRSLSPSQSISSSSSLAVSATSTSVGMAINEMTSTDSSPSPFILRSSALSEMSSYSQLTPSSSSCMTEIPTPSQPPSRLGYGGEGFGCLLWQFLLELLTDRRFKDVICWLPVEGEFILLQPDVVGTLWGRRKGRKNMSYEKLARSLRQYYDTDGQIIAKVPGKKHVYKFVFDLKFVVGYSSLDLRNLIMEGEMEPKSESKFSEPDS